MHLWILGMAFGVRNDCQYDWSSAEDKSASGSLALTGIREAIREGVAMESLLVEQENDVSGSFVQVMLAAVMRLSIGDGGAEIEVWTLSVSGYMGDDDRMCAPRRRYRRRCLSDATWSGA